MNAGMLIPDEYTIDLITKTLSSSDYETGAIWTVILVALKIWLNLWKYPQNYWYGTELHYLLEADYDLLLSRVENRLV